MNSPLSSSSGPLSWGMCLVLTANERNSGEKMKNKRFVKCGRAEANKCLVNREKKQIYNSLISMLPSSFPSVILLTPPRWRPLGQLSLILSIIIYHLTGVKDDATLYLDNDRQKTWLIMILNIKTAWWTHWGLDPSLFHTCLLTSSFRGKDRFLTRGAFFAWRAPILSWPRIMCSQVRMLKFLEPSREMP